MSPRPITTANAMGRASARLGRPAQDPLELAVVLEAWWGVRPAVALATAECARFEGQPRPAEAGIERRPRVGAAVAGILVALTSIAWMQAIGNEVGVDAAGRSLAIALPVALALIAAGHRRYVVAEVGLGVMRQDWLRVVAGVGVVLLAVAVSPAGVLGAAVVAAVLGAALTLERWPALAVVALGLPLVVTSGGAWSVEAAGVAAVLAPGFTSVLAVASTPAHRRPPMPLVLVAWPAASMAMFAVLVLASADAAGPAGWKVVAGLAPTLGALAVAANRADRLWTVLPRRLCTEPVGPHRSAVVGRVALEVMASVVGWFLVAIVTGTATVAVVAPEALVPEVWIVGLIALGSMLVEGVGHPAGAAAVVAGGLVSLALVGWSLVLMIGVLAIVMAITHLVVDVDRSFAVRW